MNPLMIFLLLGGALAALGSKKTAAAQPTAAKPKSAKKPAAKKTATAAATPAASVAIQKPAATVQTAKKKIIDAAKTPAQKQIDQTMAKKLPSVTPQAQKVLKGIMQQAADPKTPKPLRDEAKKTLKKIQAVPATQKASEINKLPAKAKQGIATALQDTTAQPTPAQAAEALQIWTRNGGNQGNRINPSATVKKNQAFLGLKADGIIGPETRKRCQELGFVLAPRTAQRAGAVGREIIF